VVQDPAIKLHALCATLVQADQDRKARQEQQLEETRLALLRNIRGIARSNSIQ
jgi:hypothetical protein